MRRIPKPSLMEGKGDHVVVDEMNINPFCSRNSERRGRRSLQANGRLHPTVGKSTHLPPLKSRQLFSRREIVKFIKPM